MAPHLQIGSQKCQQMCFWSLDQLVHCSVLFWNLNRQKERSDDIIDTVSRTEGTLLSFWLWCMSEGGHHTSEFIWLFLSCLFVCLFSDCVTVLSFPILHLSVGFVLSSFVAELNWGFELSTNCPWAVCYIFRIFQSAAPGCLPTSSPMELASFISVHLKAHWIPTGTPSASPCPPVYSSFPCHCFWRMPLSFFLFPIHSVFQLDPVSGHGALTAATPPTHTLGWGNVGTPDTETLPDTISPCSATCCSLCCCSCLSSELFTSWPSSFSACPVSLSGHWILFFRD